MDIIIFTKLYTVYELRAHSSGQKLCHGSVSTERTDCDDLPADVAFVAAAHRPTDSVRGLASCAVPQSSKAILSDRHMKCLRKSVMRMGALST